MLRLLLKKQLQEIFRGYFVDTKKNRSRSKGSTIALFILFIVLMVGCIGGMFTGLSMVLCPALTAVNVGWLYFDIICLVSMLLGVFGSVFNTFSGLYLAKDNDLLLSMPIPVRYIMISRLLGVYLMGLMYSAIALLPGVGVYLFFTGITFLKVVNGLLLILICSMFVMVLSCILGYVVAKISLKMKNRSFVTVLISLLFLGAYYFFYFKANRLISNITLNAAVYGEKIRDDGYGALYLFGRIGEGDPAAGALYTAVVVLLLLGTWLLMKKSFIRIATSTGDTAKKKGSVRYGNQQGVFETLLRKEFSRFTSSANYMLNCGLGILMIPGAGILLLLFGDEYLARLTVEVFPVHPEYLGVILSAAACMLISMNNMCAPSVSLEGKSIWLLQSLPVEPKQVLRAKEIMGILLTTVPMLFTAACLAVICPGTVHEKILFFLIPVVYSIFSSVFGVFIGLKLCNLTWTNEITIVKQSGCVAIALFTGWGYAVLAGVLCFLLAPFLGTAGMMTAVVLLTAGGTVLLQHYLDTKGAEAFRNL